MNSVSGRKRQGQAIQRRRVEQGETQESLAESLGLSQGFIAKLERGAANIDTMQVRNFSALLERLGWTPAEFGAEVGVDLGAIARDAGRGQSRAEPLRRVEVYAVTQAGPPSLEDAERTTHTYLRSEDLAAGLELYVTEGDSMTTPDPHSIHEGDILHVNTHRRDIQPGRVYLIRIPGSGVTVKRVRALGGELWLMSDNPRHPAFKPDEAEVIGEVAGWTRTIRP